MNQINKAEDAGWNFDNSYARLPEKFYTKLDPTPVSSPKIVAFNYTLSDALNLNSKVLEGKSGCDTFAGNQIPEGSLPLAEAYAGHQFGYFTMLGDGRAILLGEHLTSEGERFDIQLKGSGRTPYSRGGDGRATLGPMLREYIMSEAMNSLGIATTRSLAVVTTGEYVMRETMLPGAILTRIAKSHIRVGTFQYVAKWGAKDDLRSLADYTIQRHFKEICNNDNCYLDFLYEVIKRQAELIAKWQLVGFIHGVMNTDNMAISGETIDYGPCAFMDNYDPSTVFSSIDTGGRYAYGNQPDIAAWNLGRFAETLLPLLSNKKEEAVALAQDALSEFSKLYRDNWISGMRRKLGLYNEESDDEALIEELLQIMHQEQADFTNTFRLLTLERVVETKLSGISEFDIWYKHWQDRLKRQKESKDSIYSLMKDNNPAVIPRNHRVEEALDAAVNKGDYGVMEELLQVLNNPYAYSKEQEEYASAPEVVNCKYRTFCGT